MHQTMQYCTSCEKFAMANGRTEVFILRENSPLAKGASKMIHLEHDSLVITFPELHDDARLTIDFQRTLRIPDDGQDYPLPPGLGRFPLRHVDDYSEKIPEKWKKHGGIMFPMYQSEAMWLNFSSRYPMAVKIATGKINAVTGKEWSEDLDSDEQDYLIVPDQPWLDGYAVKKGSIRQFVAMPLGSGYSAEEQITKKAEFGGIQILVYPMKKEKYEEWKKSQERSIFRHTDFAMDGGHWVEQSMPMVASSRTMYSAEMPSDALAMPDMGLAPGGSMKQEIYEDKYGMESWDREHRSRCFVHLTNSLIWRAVTGSEPPTTPPTSAEYEAHGLPWFDYYGGDNKALEGSEVLDKLKSVKDLGKEKKDNPLPENESVKPGKVVPLGEKGNLVREGDF